jgi:DNA-binding NtrC family response regulator
LTSKFRGKYLRSRVPNWHLPGVKTSEFRQPAEELPTGFIGRSPRVAQVRMQIERLAPQRTPVLIQGETGTGKEVAARALFNAAPRGQFVPIDCGSLVGPLMESELFGHTRGAFTGAGESRKGLMDLANGGTAFFDEIGDLPVELQVKLLRLLQEREFRPVGSLQRTKVDIRIIAATHRDLPREIAAGKFREDLFHRLNVVRLTLPPLRERREDIPLLIERFISESGRRYVIDDEALDLMIRYQWPGNIRELKNCIDRMVSLSSGPVLHCEDLPSQIACFARHEENRAAPLLAMAAAAGAVPGSGIIPMHELERRAIQDALSRTKGDRTTAAHLLGIGRTTLYRKLKEYQLE